MYVYIIVTWRNGGQNPDIKSNESESVPVRLSRLYPVSDEILIALNISLKGNRGLW
jgi:hypothetical protein